jgi:hypothetical protein
MGELILEAGIHRRQFRIAPRSVLNSSTTKVHEGFNPLKISFVLWSLP